MTRTHWLIAAVVLILAGVAFFSLGGSQMLCSATGAFCPQATAPAEPVEPVPPLNDNPPVVETPPPAEELPTEPAPPPKPRPRPPVELGPVVMQETIGVAPEEVSIDDPNADETVVVPGQRQLRPQWARRPSVRRINNLYPDSALERGREGEANISCLIEDDGALDCHKVSETPANAGFGNAALRLARSYRHQTTLEDGRPAVGATVNFLILFRIAEDRRRGSPSQWGR